MPEIGEIKSAPEIGIIGSSRYIWHACERCGKERWVGLSRISHGKSFLCPQCARRGSGNKRWKGGRSRNPDGYILILLQFDDFYYPMTDKHHYVLEHRLIMAKKLGRCLQSWELVHHKGIRCQGIENRSDNLEDNLELTTRGSHSREHNKGYRDGYSKGLKDGINKQVKELQSRVTLLEAELEVIKHNEPYIAVRPR